MKKIILLFALCLIVASASAAPQYYLDQYNSSLKLLMHMNQTADHPTWFYDSSPSNKTVSVFGGAYTDTTTKLLGNASGKFNGKTDYLSVPYSADMNMGSSNWTLKFKFISNNLTSAFQSPVFVNGNTTPANGYSSLLVSYTASSLNVLFSEAELAWSNVATYSVPTTFINGTWYDIAIVRNGSVIFAYKDGVELRNWSGVGTLYNRNLPSYIGRRQSSGPGTSYLDGNVDEFAFWNGVAIMIPTLYPQTTEIETAIAPVATFTANVTSGFSPLAVQFNETSASTGTSWVWNATPLSTGIPVTIGTVQNLSYSFPTGNYTISLKSTNSGGSNVSTQVTWINVTDSTPLCLMSPWPQWSAYDRFVTLTDSSTNNPTNCTVSWGDSVVEYNCDTYVYHLYQMAGIYPLDLTVSNAGGTATNRSWIQIME
jgi:PKD repeat protein